jgi:hypothetical protein
VTPLDKVGKHVLYGGLGSSETHVQVLLDLRIGNAGRVSNVEPRVCHYRVRREIRKQPYNLGDPGRAQIALQFMENRQPNKQEAMNPT